MKTYMDILHYGDVPLRIETESKRQGANQWHISSRLTCKDQLVIERVFVVSHSNTESENLERLVVAHHKEMLTALVRGALDEHLIPYTDGSTYTDRMSASRDREAQGAKNLAYRSQAPADFLRSTSATLPDRKPALGKDLDEIFADRPGSYQETQTTYDAFDDFLSFDDFEGLEGSEPSADQFSADPLPDTQRIMPVPPMSAKSAFSGTLDVLSLGEVIDFLALSGRSGTIQVEGELGLGYVQIHEGSVISAAAPTSVHEGFAAETDTIATPEKIRTVIVDLLKWTTGVFSFTPESPSNAECYIGTMCAIDCRELLMDATREIDEFNRSRSVTH